MGSARFFAGLIMKHTPALIVGNFMSDSGVIAEELGISYDCFDVQPPVGELVVLKVWTEPGPGGAEVFRQNARVITDEEKGELELLDEHALGDWMRSRTFER